jgi:hypothetical protein
MGIAVWGDPCFASGSHCSASLELAGAGWSLERALPGLAGLAHLMSSISHDIQSCISITQFRHSVS